MNMEAKRFKIRLIAIVLAMPMLFAACNSDEPTPPGGEQPENPTQGVVDSSVKPIIFEIKSMYWKTEYDATANIYTTLCCDTDGKFPLVYKYSAEAENPDNIFVSEFTIEMGVEKQEVDITELQKQASESPDGFFNVTLEGITFKHEKKGELEISYAWEIDNIIYDAGLESRFYNIKLEGDDKKYATTLRIEDVIVSLSGTVLFNFDLSKIKYPTDRGYNNNGAKIGEYYVYLPAEACSFPIVNRESTRKHFYLVNIREHSSNGVYEELPLTLLEDEKVEGGWFYTKESTVGKFIHDEFYILDCEITANTTGKERKLELILSPDWDYAMVGALVPTPFYIIQAAE